MARTAPQTPCSSPKPTGRLAFRKTTSCYICAAGVSAGIPTTTAFPTARQPTCICQQWPRICPSRPLSSAIRTINPARTNPDELQKNGCHVLGAIDAAHIRSPRNTADPADSRHATTSSRKHHQPRTQPESAPVSITNQRALTFHSSSSSWRGPPTPSHIIPVTPGVAVWIGLYSEPPRYQDIPIASFVDRWRSVLPFNDTVLAQIKAVDAQRGYTADTGSSSFRRCDLYGPVFLAVREFNPCLGPFDITSHCPILFDLVGFSAGTFSLPSAFPVPYFDLPAVKAAINVPLNTTWVSCENPVNHPVFVHGVDGSLNSGPGSQPVLLRVIERTCTSCSAMDPSTTSSLREGPC
ncbi:hypothetical protein C8A03DRAFT_35886 [Achaetomium macrosporum]|uniref:Uncharacterized protein n=1 Tax=Achaetomium macrosporum TaxID=79813 RepID=A0AAN7C726_9PEZI|nr:hypothetical protein C8A03DRAFT_35886 [Achaetomium macrosporum]